MLASEWETLLGANVSHIKLPEGAGFGVVPDGGVFTNKVASY